MVQSKKDFCLFLCGDVMTGRGIDQTLMHPSQPQLYEPFVTDARDYVFLAEEKNGKIFSPVTMDYIWGDALQFWQELKPDLKIINLETAITASDDYWPGKGIHYRMHPLNIEVLSSANINVCTLANNHLLDWGRRGLRDTITTLKNVDIQCAGVGENIVEAMKPAICKLKSNKRVLIFSAGTDSSGVPSAWSATTNLPGVYYLSDLNHDTLLALTQNINQYRKPGDIIIFSIHWGSNWGHEIPQRFRTFSHGLIDIAKVDVVFGHSSHHPRPLEIYHGKPILYGCGDFINDYEGISGHEEYRGDLTLMYFLDFDCESLQFKKMTLVPLQIKKFSLHKASEKDCIWLYQLLNQYSSFGVQLKLDKQQLIHVTEST